MSEQKTAVELVDEMINIESESPPTTTAKTYTDAHISLLKIKSAIEREQANAERRFKNKCESLIQLEHAYSELKKSAVTMRPISELPDKVPDGCVIVAMNSDHTWVWFSSDNIPRGWLNERNGDSKPNTFCFIPRPMPERKLKPCPWCKAIPFERQNYWIIEHADECALEGTTIIRKGKEDLWGRE